MIMTVIEFFGQLFIWPLWIWEDWKTLTKHMQKKAISDILRVAAVIAICGYLAWYIDSLIGRSLLIFIGVAVYLIFGFALSLAFATAESPSEDYY